jgi:hypothetical protein
MWQLWFEFLQQETLNANFIPYLLIVINNNKLQFSTYVTLYSRNVSIAF